jgi:inorganic pyrophosphatase
MALDRRQQSLAEVFGLLFRAHPWHGVELGDLAPEVVPVFVEMLPTDSIKYELDKVTGFVKVDRPQRFSAQCPSLYGFIPQTLSGPLTAEFGMRKTGRAGLDGDGDPLDICVLSERPINRANILLKARPIGGLRMIDNGDVDDKLIAVLENDLSYGHWRDIKDCPDNMMERFEHYFLTYKEMPGVDQRKTEITHIYGREEAHEIIRRCRQDYVEQFSDLHAAFERVVGKPLSELSVPTVTKPKKK